MRDMEQKPYSEDEAKVAKFFADAGTGGGDDPIGALIVCHQWAMEQRNRYRKALQTIKDRDPDKPLQPIQWAVAVACEALDD
jgi:hypothetical protein